MTFLSIVSSANIDKKNKNQVVTDYLFEAGSWREVALSVKK